MKCSIVTGLLVVLLSDAYYVAYAQAANNCAEVSIDFSAARSHYTMGEPLEIVLTITNLSTEEILCNFAYPVMPGLRFCLSAGGDGGGAEFQMKQEAAGEGDGMISLPTRVAGGESRIIKLFLNRYASIRNAGHVDVDCSLELIVWHPVSAESPTPADACTVARSSRLAIEIVSENEQIWKMRLLALVDNLDSTDEGEKREAVEGIVFLDDPRCLGAIRRIFGMEGYEVEAIESLGRIGTSEAVETLTAMLSRCREAHLIAAVLRELGRLGKFPAPNLLGRLLATENVRMRLLVLEEITDLGADDSYLSIVTPLLSDENAQVAEQARKCQAALRGRSR